MKYYRAILILILAAVLLSLSADALLAQADAAAAPDNSEVKYLWSGNWRGPGHYLSGYKILLFFILFVLWIRITDWVNYDTQTLKLNWRRWNPIVFGSFLGTMLLFWLLPWFWAGYSLLTISVAAPLGAYFVDRRKKTAAIPDAAFESVCNLVARLGTDLICVAGFFLGMVISLLIMVAALGSAQEGRSVMAILLSFFVPLIIVTVALGQVHDPLTDLLTRGLFRLFNKEKSDPNVKGAPVSVSPAGGPNAQAEATRMLAARQSPGLPAARKILYQGLASRASAIMLDYAPTTVVVRHMVDGVWLPREAMEREAADPALEALKLLCGGNPQDRKNRQEGKFGVEYCVIRHMFFEKVDKAEAEFRERTTIELTKKYASDELTPPQLQQKVAREVEERTREKFATPIGAWTPVDRERLPKLPGIDAMNPVSAVEPMKCPATFTSQGTQGGERVLIQFEIKPVKLVSLDDVGMRAKMQEQFKELLGRSKGFILLCGIPAGGLRTTTKVIQLSMDRFMREFMAVEDEANRYDEVENVPVTTYKGSAGESPATVLPKLFRNDPNVVVVRDLMNAETVGCLCREVANEDRLVLSTIRAKDSAEALLRVLMLGVPPKEFAAQVTAVLSQRLVRKLCDKCKEAYAPAPQVLEQLGIPAGKIRALYRPPQPKPADEKRDDPCRECGGIGYNGVTAIFELLVVDDALRRVLATTPKLELVRQAARKAGLKSLQEEGILLAARGVTSVPELMRVLKQ